MPLYTLVGPCTRLIEFGEISTPLLASDYGIFFGPTCIKHACYDPSISSSLTTTSQKWHEGFYCQQALPIHRGFDSSSGFLAGGCDHVTNV